MAFTSFDPVIGTINLTDVDTAGPGPFNVLTGGSTYGRENFYNMVIRGYDANLGAGEFVYAKYSGTIAAGTVVEFTPSLSSGVITISATAWAGTANTGKPLGVALAGGAANQWGWFQVGGNAIVTTSGAPVAGNPAYFSAAGSVQPGAVASKQVLNAQYVTAPSVTIGSGASAVTLTSTQAVLQLNRPCAQGAIT